MKNEKNSNNKDSEELVSLIWLKDVLYDYVLQFIRSPLFRNPIKNFIDENCQIFDNELENSFEHTKIHNKYMELIESLLENAMRDLGISNEKFLELAELGLDKPKDKKYFEQIINNEDYLYFKDLMYKRNIQLEQEALAVLTKNRLNLLSSKLNNSNLNDKAKSDHSKDELKLAMKISELESKNLSKKRLDELQREIAEIEYALKMSLDYQEDERRRRELENLELDVSSFY